MAADWFYTGKQEILHSLSIAIMIALRHSFLSTSARGIHWQICFNRLLLLDYRYLHNFSLSITKSSKLSRLCSTQTGVMSLPCPFLLTYNAEALLSCMTNATCLKIVVQSEYIFINMNSDVVNTIYPFSFQYSYQCSENYSASSFSHSKTFYSTLNNTQSVT